MLKVDSRNKRLTPLGRTLWRQASFFERHRLADFVAGGVADVFEEVGVELMILGADVALGAESGRKADLLALDPEGRVCLVFASRRQTGLDIGLAIEDMGRVARWNWRAALESLEMSRGDELRAFIDVPLENVNREQRAFLVGEELDEEALTTARFLAERYGVSVSCLRLSLRLDEAGDAYLGVEDALAAEDGEEVWFVRSEEREAPASDLSAEIVAEQLVPDLAALAAVEEASREDPLAELIEDPLEPPLAGPDTGQKDERRAKLRFGSCHARRLRFDYFGSLMGARLIDFSEGGLGAETLAPLAVGATVLISGELSTEAGLISLEGGARVKHCRPRSDGVCRIGLSFPRSAVKEVVGAEAFDRR